MSLLVFLIVGLVAGLAARVLVPGPDPMGLAATLILGVIGSFVGGLIVALFTDTDVLDFNTTGLIGSIVGAVVALIVYRTVKRS